LALPYFAIIVGGAQRLGHVEHAAVGRVALAEQRRLGGAVAKRVDDVALPLDRAVGRVGWVERGLAVLEVAVLRVGLAQVLQQLDRRVRRHHLGPEFVLDLRLEQRRDVLAGVGAHGERAFDQQLGVLADFLARVALQQIARYQRRGRGAEREQDEQHEVELDEQFHGRRPWFESTVCG
jgi:hypothetical protein